MDEEVQFNHHHLGEAGCGRGGAVSLAWLLRAWLALGMPAMEEGVQFPWPGSSGILGTSSPAWLLRAW